MALGLNLPPVSTPAIPGAGLVTGGNPQSSISQISLTPISPLISGNSNLGAGIQIGGNGSPTISTYNPLKPKPPVSPLTGKPVASFGTGLTTSTAPSTVSDTGSYKGIAITPGTDQEIAAQVARIDAGTPTQLATGGIVSADTNGNINSPNSFSIDTSGPVDSSVLASNLTKSDVTNTRKTYQDYLQGLAQAQQYSPDFIAAQQALNQANQNQLQHQVQGNYQGDTTEFAQGITARQMQTDELAKNAAANALQVQTLLRSGNIAAATALAQGNAPQTVSPGASLVNPVTGEASYNGIGGYQAVQAIQTVNNLAQTYPDAGISPNDTLQTAQQKASASPSFSSRQLVQVTLPGGGIEFVNKNQLHTNSDGSYSIVSSGDATAQNAASSTIKDLTAQRAQLSSAITTVDQNFPLLLQAAKAAGVNNNAPFINEITQKIANKTSQSAALAQLNALVPSVSAEYSRIIARGGTVDDSTRKSAQAVISGTYSLNQLNAVYQTLKKEGANVIKGYDDEITKQNAVFSGSSGGGGLYAF